MCTIREIALVVMWVFIAIVVSSLMCVAGLPIELCAVISFLIAYIGCLNL